jgi:hypothetical protein
MQGARVSRQWGTDETYKILDKTRQTAVVFWQQEDREEVKMKVSETLEHRFPSSQSWWNECKGSALADKKASQRAVCEWRGGKTTMCQRSRRRARQQRKNRRADKESKTDQRPPTRHNVMSWGGGNYAHRDARRQQGLMDNTAVPAEEENGWMNGVDE